MKKRNKWETKYKKQLGIYNPDKAAMGTKFKGDLPESGLHGVWHLLGGDKWFKSNILGKKRNRTYAV